MSKIAMMRFFAVVAVVTCVVHVSADVMLKGPEAKRIVVNKDTFDYKIDYTKTYAFYNTTDNKQRRQSYELHVGDCTLKFLTKDCKYLQVGKRHHMVLKAGVRIIDYFHDDFPVGTVKSSSISFHAIDYIDKKNTDETYQCSAQFDSSSEPGKFVVDVSLTGEVAPDLVVNFIGAELFTTTMSTTTTTQEPTTTTLAPTTTTLAPTTTTQENNDSKHHSSFIKHFANEYSSYHLVYC